MNRNAMIALFACLTIALAQPAAAEEAGPEPGPETTTADGGPSAPEEATNETEDGSPPSGAAASEKTLGCDAYLLTNGNGLVLHGNAYDGYSVGYFIPTTTTLGTVGTGAFVDVYCIIPELLDKVTPLVANPPAPVDGLDADVDSTVASLFG